MDDTKFQSYIYEGSRFSLIHRRGRGHQESFDSEIQNIEHAGRGLTLHNNKIIVLIAAMAAVPPAPNFQLEEWQSQKRSSDGWYTKPSHYG